METIDDIFWGYCQKCCNWFFKEKLCYVYCNKCRKPNKKKKKNDLYSVCPHNKVKVGCVECGYP